MVPLSFRVVHIFWDVMLFFLFLVELKYTHLRWCLGALRCFSPVFSSILKMTDYQASLQHHGVARGSSFQLGKTPMRCMENLKIVYPRNYQFLGPWNNILCIPTIPQFGDRLELVKRPDEWMEHSAMGFLSLKGRCCFFEWKQKVLRATAFSSWSFRWY